MAVLNFDQVDFINFLASDDLRYVKRRVTGVAVFSFVKLLELF